MNCLSLRSSCSCRLSENCPNLEDVQIRFSVLPEHVRQTIEMKFLGTREFERMARFPVKNSAQFKIETKPYFEQAQQVFNRVNPEGNQKVKLLYFDMFGPLFRNDIDGFIV